MKASAAARQSSAARVPIRSSIPRAVGVSWAARPEPARLAMCSARSPERSSSGTMRMMARA